MGKVSAAVNRPTTRAGALGWPGTSTPPSARTGPGDCPGSCLDYFLEQLPRFVRV